jgi:ABC-type amino acid transport substrate-binding protein
MQSSAALPIHTPAGRRAALLCIGLVAAFAASAPAAGTTVRACMIDEEPWGSLATPDKGVYAEVFAEIGRLTGYTVETSVAPLVRTFDNVRTGYCQFTITSWQPARAATLSVGATLAMLDYGVLPRRGHALTSVADLKGMTVATARGLLLGPEFDDDAAIRKVGVYGYEQAMRMTEAGRADAAAGSIISLARLARRHGTATQFGTPLVLARIKLSVQKNLDFAATDTARHVDDAVDRLRASGEADEIIARYFAK